MCSALVTMAAGRSSSRMRLPSLSASACDQISTGCSGSPVLHSSDVDIPIPLKPDTKKNDGDDNNNNNRTASAYLLKLLDAKDLSNDLDGSPSAFNDSDSNNFSYISMKSASGPTTRSTAVSKANSSSQKKNTRSSQTHRHKPAEVFRKDLISAMKIPDTSQLLHEEYWIMQDPWRIEWEKGVQVPVNQKSIPQKNVRVLTKETHGDFRMPRKMVKSSPDVGDKEMIDFNVLADSTCRYDLDELDVCWLKVINQERKLMGFPVLDEYSMEQIMEELETQCHENMQVAIQTKEGLGIEYDEDVVCDVCRLPDCEEGNEMVFCDGCNLCVHQACYGILKVPEGSWLCKPCALGIRGSAVCVLCNRKGGAMKSTRSGNKWAHVSCALWIPEISIGDPDRMEPITKISHVPSSRWSLLCSLCKERVGACIQCSVKHCVTPYHVTCAVESKLDMIADCSGNSIDDDAVIFRSYCKKHSKNRKDSDTEEERTAEEKRSQRHHRIMELEEEFYTFVKASAVESTLSVPLETAEQVMVYWKLKRKSNFNKPLITPKHEEDTALAEAAETNLQRRLRMFTHLRQDLERVRNLCYMIGRREKTKRATVKNMESVFLTQMKLLERRMCHEPNYDSVRMVSTLQKFGKPKVCEVARKESGVLAKYKEWIQGSSRTASPTEMQDVEENTTTKKKADDSTRDEHRLLSRQISRHKSINAGLEDMLVKDHDKNLSSRASATKNGLHRKAFVSACRKREAILKKDVVKPSLERTPSIKEVSINLSPRKRSYKGSSESDLERENKVPLEKTATKKTKLSKAQSWRAWRTTGAAASPSSFTVKTETVPKDEKADPGAVKDSMLLSRSTRRTRSSRLSSNMSVENNRLDDSRKKSTDLQDLSEAGKRLLTETSPQVSLSPLKGNSHLIVKWDSDKNDSPNITEKSTVVSSRKTSRSEQIISPKRTRSGDSQEKVFDEHWSSESSSKALPSMRFSTRSNGSISKSPSVDESANHSASHRPPRRLAAAKAKNESGALARSCESGSFDVDVKAASSEQELQEKRFFTQPNASERLGPRRGSSNSVSQKERPKSTGVMSCIDNFPDEDGGYKGDMDESDSGAVSQSRHKNIHAHHRLLFRESVSSTYSATGDSGHSDHSKKFVSKKHRLKAIRKRRRGEASLVSFKGFRDIEDDSNGSPVRIPSKLDQDNCSPPLITVDLNQDLPKNEQAAGDICDKDVHLDAKVNSPVAGGCTNIKDEIVSASTGNYVSTTTEQNNPMQANSYYSTSVQDYHAYMQNQCLYPQEHLMNMPYISPHNLYYSSLSQYPFHLWPPPPPPPPPNDAPYDGSPDGESPVHPLPDSTLSPEGFQKPISNISSLDQHNLQFYPNTSFISTDVPYSQIEAEGLPTNSEYPAQEVDPAVTRQPLKKKKKKSKKRKKKKKRKRRHSQSEYPSTLGSDYNTSGSDVLSGAGSGYDEYCVEYCSTLTDAPFQAERIPSEREDSAIPVDVMIPNDFETATVSQLASSETSPTPQTLQTTPITTDVVSPPNLVKNQSSRLLLKIDKKKLVLNQEINHESSSIDDSSSNDSTDHVHTHIEKPDKGFISPLKLKLCWQKSDRTLRGGLVAREYQILDSDEAQSQKQDPPVEENVLPIGLQSPPKVNRAHVAMRRLGLQVDNNSDVSGKRSLRERKTPKSKPDDNPALTAGSPSGSLTSKPSPISKSPFKNLKTKTSESRKKVRPIKPVVTGSPLPPTKDSLTKSTTTSISMTNKTSQASGEKINSLSVSNPSLQPERHWKKRKLHVHEASVTTHLNNGPNQKGNVAIETSTALTSAEVKSNTSQTIAKSDYLMTKPPSNSKCSPPALSSGKIVLDTASVTSLSTTKTESTIPRDHSKRKTPSDSGKLSLESFRSSRDGLPPVSPYKFTVSNTHQRKMAAPAPIVPDEKSKTWNKLFLNKSQQSVEKSSPEKKLDRDSDDPYEFEDFES